VQEQIFALTYYGRFNSDHVENMITSERQWFYNRLVEEKEKEQQAHKKSI
jgi:hypothetical protein